MENIELAELYKLLKEERICFTENIYETINEAMSKTPVESYLRITVTFNKNYDNLKIGRSIKLKEAELAIENIAVPVYSSCPVIDTQDNNCMWVSVYPLLTPIKGKELTDLLYIIEKEYQKAIPKEQAEISLEMITTTPKITEEEYHGYVRAPRSYKGRGNIWH